MKTGKGLSLSSKTILVNLLRCQFLPRFHITPGLERIEEKPMSKFLFSFGVIAFGLFLGYAIQILAGRGIIRLPMEMERLRKLILKSALFT